MPDFEMYRCERHSLDLPKVTKAQADEHGLPFGCPPCTTPGDQP